MWLQVQKVADPWSNRLSATVKRLRVKTIADLFVIFYFFGRITFEIQLAFQQNSNLNLENAQNLTFKN